MKKIIGRPSFSISDHEGRLYLKYSHTIPSQFILEMSFFKLTDFCIASGTLTNLEAQQSLNRRQSKVTAHIPNSDYVKATEVDNTGCFHIRLMTANEYLISINFSEYEFIIMLDLSSYDQG